MKNKKGNVAVITIIIVIVAITAGVIGWLIARTTQAPALQPVATQPQQVQTAEPTNAPISALTNTTAATAPAPASQAIQNPAPQPDPKVAIHFTIKDSGGKLLKGILCQVTTNNKSNTKMTTVASKTSDSDGNCFFENLDPANPYLVRAYWTADKSRDSMVSLSWITPGTTISRVIVKP